MLSFSHIFDDYIEQDGKKISVNLAYDNVLKAYELLNSNEERAPERIFSALKCFGVKGRYSITERAELLKRVFSLINFYSHSIDRYNYSQGNNEVKVIDYIRDMSLIYSAFLQAYSIDLFEQKGKLHWVKFISLLNNMPDDTRLSKVIAYRSARIPPANRYNKQEVARVRELKNIYRLEEEPEKVQDRINKALAGVFGR